VTSNPLRRGDSGYALSRQPSRSAQPDAEARRIMREKAEGADCELWLGDRLIDFVSGAEG
jgi:hypothetical protein